MKLIHHIEDLQEKQYYLFTPKEGLAPYLCGIYRLNILARHSEVFSVDGRRGEWHFGSFETIFAVGEQK